MMESMLDIRFALGRLEATPNALEAVEPSEIDSALLRHANGDWGDILSYDGQDSDDEFEAGDRFFSVYHTKMGVEFWIVSEADLSATTIILPEEYDDWFR